MADPLIFIQSDLDQIPNSLTESCGVFENSMKMKSNGYSNHDLRNNAKSSTRNLNGLVTFEKTLEEADVREDFLTIVRDLEDRALHFASQQKVSYTPSVSCEGGLLTISSG